MPMMISPVSPVVFRQPRSLSLSSPLLHHHTASSPLLHHVFSTLLHHHTSVSSSPFLLHRFSSPFTPKHHFSSSFTPNALLPLSPLLSSTTVPNLFPICVDILSKHHREIGKYGLSMVFTVGLMSFALGDKLSSYRADPFVFCSFLAWLIAAIYHVAPSTNLPYAQSLKAVVIFFASWILLELKATWFLASLSSLSRSSKLRERILWTETLTSLFSIVTGFVLILHVFGTTGENYLAVFGLGAFATGYASKDVLGNILSGLSLHFSHHFSLGETIKTDSYQGEVLKIGLLSTSLLDSDTKLEITVSNTQLASQVIFNLSRAHWQGRLSFKIPLNLSKIPEVKIPLISMEIIDALKVNPQVCLEEEIPVCYLCDDEKKDSLMITYNIRRMRTKEEFFYARLQIRLLILRILKKHGVLE